MPSNRPESLREFLEAWESLFKQHDVKLFVVQDTDEPWDFDTPVEFEARSRKQVPGFIPVGTDMIRSWGMYLAWRHHAPYVLTLDDDVRPISDFDPFEAYEQEFERGSVSSRFLSVGALTTSDLQLRGFPYRERKRAKVAIQYGGWNGVLDFDAATQLSAQPGTAFFRHIVMPVPRGVPVTTCIMNAAWRVEYTPIMWQLPMLHGKYNRFGDIWSGLFQKRVLDILGDVMLVNGRASVEHERASDPIKNLEREQPGIYFNEQIADVVFDSDMPSQGAFGARIEEQDIATIYRCVTDWASSIFPPDYRYHFLSARDQWLALFDV